MSNPYLLDRPAVINFSGGRTSGYMLWHVLDAFGGTLPDDVKVVFCNTGKERPETLDFVERCSQRWGVEVVWLEYRYEGPPQDPVPEPTLEFVVSDEMELDEGDDEYAPTGGRQLTTKWRVAKSPRRRCRGRHTFAVVDYPSASRNGEPLEQVIAARGMLPNVTMRFCTVECKIRTTQRYLKSIGWDLWTSAIGFRADEPQRVAKLNGSNKHTNEEPVAPLYKAGVTKGEIMAWWDRQPFRLELMDHEGNCDLCFLKGRSKLEEIMRRRPDLADWWIRMEGKIQGGRYGTGRFRNDRPSYLALRNRSQLPGLFDDVLAGDDELSISCHCTD